MHDLNILIYSVSIRLRYSLFAYINPHTIHNHNPQLTTSVRARINSRKPLQAKPIIWAGSHLFTQFSLSNRSRSSATFCSLLSSENLAVKSNFAFFRFWPSLRWTVRPYICNWSFAFFSIITLNISCICCCIWSCVFCDSRICCCIWSCCDFFESCLEVFLLCWLLS